MKKMFREVVDWLYDLWLKSLSDKEVENYYIEAGAEFGDAMSYDYLGKCHDFDSFFLDWARWELEYSKRGYRTISLNDFISYGGYGKPLKGLGVKRKEGEQIILYSVIYSQNK